MFHLSFGLIFLCRFNQQVNLVVKWQFIVNPSFLYVAILLLFENLFTSLEFSIKTLYSIFGFMKHVYASGMKVKLDIDMEFSFYSMHTDFTNGCSGPNIYQTLNFIVCVNPLGR